MSKKEQIKEAINEYRSGNTVAGNRVVHAILDEKASKFVTGYHKAAKKSIFVES